ncbi:MAG: class I SAM-dependent methyltransferase [Hyphomonadaceae bacterium]|nr:class I SAM-dependent methyltransferase [Hyphomonadaceae bacterium]
MTLHYSEYGFADPENAKRYGAGSPAMFLPGFSVMHALTAQMLAETTPPDGKVLVLGAGGGLEVAAFAEREPGWHFTAVDPSPEMLAVGRENLNAFADRIDWIDAYIPDAPAGPFDAATCLLTLHLIADDGEKLQALKAIRARLKPGGAFVVVDNCNAKDTPDFDVQMDRFIEQARRSGVPADLLGMVRQNNTEKGEMIPEEREVDLLTEAGFRDIHLIFAALSWRGWVARA